MSCISSKTCTRCGLTKSLSEFYSAGPTRLHVYCKDCMRHSAKLSARRAAKDPIKRKKRDAALRELQLAKYGLSLSDYEALLEIQGGRCGICGTTEPGRVDQKNFATDHCHETGKVRGLLCNRCNRALGLLGDNPDTLRSAARYLERAQCHKKTRS